MRNKRHSPKDTAPEKIAGFVTVFLSCLPALAAMAAEPIDGEYQQVLRIDGQAQPVFLDINRQDLRESGARIRYALPRDCRKEAQYSGFVQGWHIYTVTQTYIDCDPYPAAQDVLQVRSAGENRLEYLIVRNERTVERAVLVSDRRP